MFFADFCEHLNVKLQGGGKTLDVTFGYINVNIVAIFVNI